MRIAECGVTKSNRGRDDDTENQGIRTSENQKTADKKKLIVPK